jgi:hypothetical protein
MSKHVIAMEIEMADRTVKSVLIAICSAWATVAWADWTNLPDTGVSVSGGTSAYILCNPTGAMGTGGGANAPVKPTSIADACALMPATPTTVPDSSYTGLNAIPIASSVRYITLGSVNLGTVREYVWRKPVSSGYECIYATQVNMDVAGFVVKDVARKGFAGKTMDVAYSSKPTVAQPVYRIGRTFTSVQYRNESGFVTQPLTGLGLQPAINGIDIFPTPSGHPTASEQKSDIDTDWVDFTTTVTNDSEYSDRPKSSSTFYVRTTCNSGSLTTATDAIRLRQTGAAFTEISVTGFLPN